MATATSVAPEPTPEEDSIEQEPEPEPELDADMAEKVWTIANNFLQDVKQNKTNSHLLMGNCK